ncbi:hypothetical protein KKC1_07730 [Calderihabitans maritimus]|uniref:Uncharacterized protein n=1 Tax=Calderihabitans maritimus TaxID=1246530 RepID=A0A1Z5HQ03_9FIRM|nr:hypothetical protein KKC1_07730 [Calderihabitans maritimus]
MVLGLLPRESRSLPETYYFINPPCLKQGGLFYIEVVALN